MNAICLVVDRLHVGYLGCYGNSWIATPELDRLAVEGFVFDQALAPSPRLPDLYRSLWSGVHPVEPEAGGDSLPRKLSAAGIATALVTDDPDVARLAEPAGLGEIVRCDPPRLSEPADDIEQTGLASFFAAATAWLDSGPAEPFCLWLHTSALGTAWDAPFEFRQRYVEEGDPPPPRLVVPPCCLLQADYDPDELLGFTQAYAGQVSLLDLCLGGMLDAIRDAHLDRSTLIVLISARGFPLGEHRRVGAVDEALHAELVHVPWLMRFPDGLGAADRSSALVQAADLHHTLTDWWGLDKSTAPKFARGVLPLVRGEGGDWNRDRLCVAESAAERAIRTPAWYLRCTTGEASRDAAASAESPGEVARLYVKPDDRWEMNDVADRCQDIVESLRGSLETTMAALAASQTEQLAPLDETLLHSPE